jgi:hypothetical protein
MTNQSKAIDARQVDNLDDDPDDFDVAYAVARDILDWPVGALRDIQKTKRERGDQTKLCELDQDEDTTGVRASLSVKPL